MSDADARAEIERLWGREATPRPGRKGARSPREIARAGIQVADEGGLGALSMRTVAGRLGMATMGLYSYVPGRPELIEVMIDEVYAELPLSYADGEGWRDRLRRVAKDNWDLLMRHPWLADVEDHRPVLGPNVIAKYDFELAALEGEGLDDVTLDHALATLLGFVHGAARAKLSALAVARRTGLSDAEWWRPRAALLEARLGGRYPLARRVGAAAGARHDGPADPDAAFEFGLEVLLDGLERRLAAGAPV